jgi:hypothetical protein
MRDTRLKSVVLADLHTPQARHDVAGRQQDTRQKESPLGVVRALVMRDLGRPEEGRSPQPLDRLLHAVAPRTRSIDSETLDIVMHTARHPQPLDLVANLPDHQGQPTGMVELHVARLPLFITKEGIALPVRQGVAMAIPRTPTGRIGALATAHPLLRKSGIARRLHP